MARPTPFPEPFRLETARGGFSLHEAGPADGIPLVMLHGWPELAHSWAPVYGPLAEAGYRCLMPDLKGFGASDRPRDASAYSAAEMTADFCAMLDALKIERAIFAGHDWGGALVWPMGWRHPDRVMGIIGLCTPHTALPPVPPLGILEKRYTAEHYIVRFQDEDLPDRVFGGKEPLFFRFVFRHGPPQADWPSLFPEITWLPVRFREADPAKMGPPVMGEGDLRVYEEAYAGTGHKTPTHVYRNIDENWRAAQSKDMTIRVPSLMMTAERDIFLPPMASLGMETLVPDLTRAMIDSGHWVTWEAPGEVSRIMLDWLTARFPVQRK